MKTNRKLAELVIKDLATLSGMQFRYPDRLTREEAGKVRAWAETTPHVVKAYRNSGDADHEAARLFGDVVNHFATEHAQTDAGEPTTWPARAPAGVPTAEKPFADLHPDEAEALLAWGKVRPEYREAYGDAKHAQHGDYVSQTTQLMELVHSGAEHPAEAAAPAPGAPLSGAARAEIDALMRDPAYTDRSNPHHQAAVEKVTRAYQAAYQEPGAAAPAAAAPAQAQPPGAADPRERIREIERNPAYVDKSHAGHADAVAQMSAAYAETFPEPVAEG